MAWNMEEAIAYYKNQGAPSDQNALIQLLREVQRERGDGIPSYMIRMIADSYGIKEGILLALVKRIPSLRLSDAHCLELCAGPNCGKHQVLAKQAELLKKQYGFELKYVPCMRLCGKGPNVRWDGKIYHQMTRQILKELIQEKKEANR